MSSAPQDRYLPRKMPAQKRSRATVTAILDAAARVLIEIGYDHATTNTIAERAGVGIGSLYEYFPGKEAIFAELKRCLNAEMFEAMMAHIGDLTDLEPATVLERVVEARVYSVRINAELYAALRDQIPHQVTADQTDEFIDTFEAISIAFLKANKLAVRPRPPELVSDVAMRAMYAIVEDLAVYAPQKLSEPAYISELKSLITSYVLVR